MKQRYESNSINYFDSMMALHEQKMEELGIDLDELNAKEKKKLFNEATAAMINNDPKALETALKRAKREPGLLQDIGRLCLKFLSTVKEIAVKMLRILIIAGVTFGTGYLIYHLSKRFDGVAIMNKLAETLEGASKELFGIAPLQDSWKTICESYKYIISILRASPNMTKWMITAGSMYIFGPIMGWKGMIERHTPMEMACTLMVLCMLKGKNIYEFAKLGLFSALSLMMRSNEQLRQFIDDVTATIEPWKDTILSKYGGETIWNFLNALGPRLKDILSIEYIEENEGWMYTILSSVGSALRNTGNSVLSGASNIWNYLTNK
jgi:hypothetical protein